MDLLSSRPFWPIRDGLPASFPALTAHATCEVAIIGGGISGALCAWQLVDAGLDVLLLDRRDVAHGSTAGNTGLILYELDEPLHRLAQRFGRDRAGRALRRCRDAIDGTEKLVRRLRLDCEFERKSSLLLAASPRDVGRLELEFAARKAARFDVEWWSRRRIADESTLPHAAGILAREAAQLDPYRFTYGLLMAAKRRGARIHDRTEVTRHEFRRGGVELFTARGTRVRARHLVVASGYESEAFLPKRVGKLQSTFAIVSEPVVGFPGWPASRCLVWDTGDPYLYLRTTADGRAIIGGGDAPFRNPAARDRLVGKKSRALQRQFRAFFPQIPFETFTAWAGTFGTTSDGLPYIDRHRAAPHTWFALGFGGNGTVFSFIAAEIIAAALRGGCDPDAELFRFDR